MKHERAKEAVVSVGAGRGFVVVGQRDRLVITAAHCLPHLPPAAAISYAEERTYIALLGPLGQNPSVTAECLFVDPIADIAVLGPPDNQALPDAADAYDQLIVGARALPIATGPTAGTAWLLSLDDQWRECAIKAKGGALWIFNAVGGIIGGMSGSPILADDGAAIGVVCSGNNRNATEGGPNPRLVSALPGWLLVEVAGHVR